MSENASKTRDQLVEFAARCQQVIIFFKGRQSQPCVSVGYVLRVTERTVLIGFSLDDREPHAMPIDIVERIELVPKYHD